MIGSLSNLSLNNWYSTVYRRYIWLIVRLSRKMENIHFENMQKIKHLFIMRKYSISQRFQKSAIEDCECIIFVEKAQLFTFYVMCNILKHWQTLIHSQNIHTDKHASKYPCVNHTFVIFLSLKIISSPNPMECHSLESSLQDDSNEWSLHRVWWKSKDFSI